MDQSNPPQVPFRHRHDGWTSARQRQFLIALGTGGCLKDACAAVGLSKTSAYRAKARMPEFAAAWDKALERMTPVLEHVAYTRAVDGWEEQVFQGGKLVGHKWRWSERMLKLLIQRPAPVSAAALPAPGSAEAVAAAKAAAKLAGGTFGTDGTREETTAALVRALAAVARVRKRAAGDGGG